MIADALDDGDTARVAHAEAFAAAPVRKEASARGAVHDGVAEDGVFGWIKAAVLDRLDADLASGHAFADIVVGLADEGEPDPPAEEGGKGLSRAAGQGDVERTLGETVVAV